MKYRWKTRPYAHQVRAVKTLLRNGYGGALLMEPRTGKTKATIDYLSILTMQGKIDRALIICPTRVIDVWVQEFQLHSPLRLHVTIWNAKARKTSDLPKPDHTLPYDLWVVITNYEAFATPGKKRASGRRDTSGSGRWRARNKVKTWVGRNDAACVLDESHKIKSPSGKAAMMIVRLGQLFRYRVILTGTPITKAKRAHDIYMQWKFLNPERFAHIPTAKAFKNHFGVWIHDNGYPQWVGSRNQPELHRLVHKDSFAVKREDCFDLPPRDTEVISVPLRTSAKVYDEMAEEMIAELESGKVSEASIKLVQTLRLSQITGGFVKTTDGEIERVGFEKLDVMKELFLEMIEHEEKVVVAAQYRADLDAIVSLATQLKIPVFRMQGQMKREETDTAIRQFRSLKGVGAFVVQPAAGSLGIDLSTASRMVWYSLTNSWANYTQCCDRIALSRKSTTFTYLLAKGTIDEVMYQALITDGDVARAILDRPQSLRRSVRKG